MHRSNFIMYLFTVFSLFFENWLLNIISNIVIHVCIFIFLTYFQTTLLLNATFKVAFQLPWQTHHLGMYQILILQIACRYINKRSHWCVWIEIKMQPSMFCKCNIICYSYTRHGIQCCITNVRFIYSSLWGIHLFGNGNLTLRIMSSTGIP